MFNYAGDVELCTLDEEDLKEMLKKDITPIVEMDRKSNQVLVKLVTFSKWGGFSRRTFGITKGPLGGILKIELISTEVLVEYVSGIMF